MAVRQYIGARYVPVFFTNELGGTDWRANTQYEPLTIVTYNGNSYTSKQMVPAGIGAPDTNADYWASTGIFNAQVEEYRQQVLDLAETVEENDKSVNGRINALNYSYEGTKVVGHAGASGVAPANTMASFSMAAMLEADAIEADLQITSDNVLVCSHNPTIGGYTIRETDSSVIRDVTVTGNYDTNFAEQKVPLYEDFVLLCKNAGKECVTEIKWEGDHIAINELPIVVNLLKKYDMLQHTLFISWYREPLRALQALDSNIKVMPLLGSPLSVTEAEILQCAEEGCYGVGIPRYADVSLVIYAHNQGLRVNVFTLGKNDSVMSSFMAVGADYLTSEFIIDVGAANNPYASAGGVYKPASVNYHNGQAVISKFFTKCDSTFPALNTSTGRFSTVNAEKIFPNRISDMLTNYANITLNVSAGSVISINIYTGYRFTILYFKANGDYVSGTNWLDTVGLAQETVPANSEVAIINIQKNQGNDSMDYWDLALLNRCISVK